MDTGYARKGFRPQRQACCKKCKCSDNDLNYPSQVSFGQSAWPVPPLVYVSFRFIRFAVFIWWMIDSFSNKFADPNYGWPDLWLVYDPAAHLAYFLVTFMGVTLVISIIEWCNKNPKDGPCKWYHKLEWVLFNITTCVSFSVPEHYYNVGTLGTASIMVEFFTTGIPIRFFHVWHAYVYILLYTVLIVPYWAAGGEKYLNVASRHVTWFLLTAPVLIFFVVRKTVNKRDDVVQKMIGIYEHCQCHDNHEK